MKYVTTDGTTAIVSIDGRFDLIKTLEVEQGCVSLGAVIQLCVDAQSTEHHDAADTEQVFLFDAVFPIATIKFVCEWTVEP